VARRNYHDRSQYPEVFFEIETSLNSVRAWIKNYKYFCNFKISIAMLGLHIEEIGHLIKRLTMICSATYIVSELKPLNNMIIFMIFTVF